MPIPKLNRKGFLPVGIHDCTLEELRKRFGSFTTSDRRIVLCDKLFELIADAKATNLVDEIIVDGSFTTSKEKPSDIDLLIVLNDAVVLDKSVDMIPADYNTLSKRVLRRRYGFDVFVDNKNGELYKSVLRLFQKVKESPDKKGMLRIKL